MKITKREKVIRASVLAIGILFFVIPSFQVFSAQKEAVKQKKQFPQCGSVNKIEQQFERLFPADGYVERVAEGFVLAQSCQWDNKDSVLISDTGSNIIYSWNERKGLTQFQRLRVYSTNLTGLYGPAGIAVEPSGRIVICHHGDRRILKMETSKRFVSIAEYFNWFRFNGPYGIAIKSNGDIYFTDPPFNAIEPTVASPGKELLYNGIYRITKNGYIDLLSSKLNSPMGLAFSPDEKFLYVLNQDESSPSLMRIAVKKDGSLEKPELFFDLTGIISQKKGQLGGIAVDKNGNIYAATPQGILVISEHSKHLGTILTDQPATSCAFGDKGKFLYITTRNSLCRVKTAR